MAPIRDVWILLERTATGELSPLEAHRSNESAMAAAGALGSSIAEVKKVPLRVDDTKEKKAKTPKKTKKTPDAVTESGDELAEDNDTTPSSTKSVQAPSQTIEGGIPNILHGMSVIFTGTMSQTRKIYDAIAETYGATIAKKLEDADYIVLGTKPGPKKLEEIEEKNLRSITEAEFRTMVQTGVPGAKRDYMTAMAAQAGADGPLRKKQK